MSTRPSLLMSPTSVGPRPARPTPRKTVAWGCGVAWAASLGRPDRPLETRSTASRINTATPRGPQGLLADILASHPSKRLTYAEIRARQTLQPPPPVRLSLRHTDTDAGAVNW